MCDPDTDDGEWITKYDIVEEDSALVLKDTGAVRSATARVRVVGGPASCVSCQVRACSLITEGKISPNASPAGRALQV